MRQQIFIFLLLLSAIFTCRAQEDLKKDSNEQAQFRAPIDFAVGYENWLKKDVVYIITAEEKKAFEELKTDEEREIFIENFWRRRDPTPDTEENEFREEHYERIAYANENFESKIPGWMTARGKIYIVWGKPDKVERGYAAFEENVNPVLYEKWFYEHIKDIGDGIEITFIDPKETNEFYIPELSKPELDLVDGFGSI